MINHAYPYQIYCDMDGVLVDFESGAIKAMNKELQSGNPKFPKHAAKAIEALGRNYVTLEDIQKYAPSQVREASAYMYILLEDDEDFWADLDWMAGGEELWAYISQFGPEILTSPMNEGGKTGSLAGKLRWIKKNLNFSDEELEKRVNFEHEKWKYAMTQDGKPNILIDDFESKIKPFLEADGIGILHKSAQRTIKILKSIADLN